MEKYPKKRAYASDKLRKFLNEKGVYDKFVYNCKKLEAHRNNKFMSSSFEWNRTDEGWKFWSKLQKEYCDINKGI